MSAAVRGAVIGAVSLVALMALGATAHAAADTDFKCRKTINKGFTNYVKVITKITQKCNEGSVKVGRGQNAPGGTIIACDPYKKIGSAWGKLFAKILGQCDDNGITPADIGWPAMCPNFEGSTCANAVTDAASIVTCLDCIAESAIARAMDLYYLNLANPAGNPDLIACQVAVGKEMSQFFLGKEKALSACRQNVDKLKGTLPCPVPGDGKAGPAIDKAEAKAVAKISQLCGGQGPGSIGFVPTCPAVQVPGGLDCGAIGSVNTLTDLVACVDCVTEFKVDCLDALAAPHQGSYPIECNPPQATPTASATAPVTATPTLTATPTATTTPTTTAIPTVTATPTVTTTEPTPTPTGTPHSSGTYTDNGDGTVTDSATGLMWEQKTTAVGSGQNYADPHDVDNYYTWNASGTYPYPPDGTAFTDFLVKLNTVPCFAGHCDWRLPSEDGQNSPYTGPKELETILLSPCPGGTSPCIDPIFGPTVALYYWSTTTNALQQPYFAWIVYFNNGLVDSSGDKSTGVYVRAVRTGS